MSDQHSQTGNAYVGAPTEGVLGRRFFAYFIDLIMIFGLVLIFGFFIGILGIVTLGLAWGLYAILIPAVAIIYSAATVGGPGQGTIGMRMVGLRAVHAATGGRVDKITAAVHALLFYVAAGTFILLVIDVVIGAMRDDRRLGHDLLAGLMLVRR
jgi:uncharacterized RDD family membrane protein YckC